MKPEDLPLKKRLIQLAEEAAELAQASLKMIRAMEGDTPVGEETAWAHVLEEMADVEVCMYVSTNKEDREKILYTYGDKYQRWGVRLNGRSEVSQVHTE